MTVIYFHQPYLFKKTVVFFRNIFITVCIQYQLFFKCERIKHSTGMIYSREGVDEGFVQSKLTIQSNVECFGALFATSFCSRK